MPQDLGTLKLLPGQTIAIETTAPETPVVTGLTTKRRRRITSTGTWVEPPPPPPPVDPPPIVLPFPGWAAAEAAVPSGGIVDVPPGLYKLTSKLVLTKPGVRWRLRQGAVVDLTGLATPIQQAGVSADGPGIEWQGGTIHGSTGGGFRGEGPGVKLIDAELCHHRQEAVIWHGADGRITGGEHHHNNETGQMWNGSEQGWGKAHAERLIVDGVHVHDIGLGGADPLAGQGVWFDQWYPDGTPISARALNSGAEVKNCRIERVFYAGIMYEISRGGKFHDNVILECGTTPSGSGFWGSGILISSAQDAEVYGNLLVRNQSGIRVVCQNRADRPGVTRNVALHDNTFIGNPHHDFAFDTDHAASAAEMFAPTSGNVAFANRFGGPIRVYWKPQGTLTTLAAVNALPGGGGSTMLTPAQVATILAANGIAA